MSWTSLYRILSFSVINSLGGPPGVLCRQGVVPSRESKSLFSHTVHHPRVTVVETFKPIVVPPVRVEKVTGGVQKVL